MTHRPGTVFLGTPGPLATGTLEGLLSLSRLGTTPPVNVVVVVGSPPPEPHGLIPVLNDDALTELALDHQLPVRYTNGHTHQDIHQALVAIAPGRVIQACLATILPAATLALIPYGIWNVHPSTLPHFRGPAPMFWQFRAGLTVGGVSLHLLDSGIDTGPVSQRWPVPLATGMGELEAEHQAGRTAGLALARRVAKGSWPDATRQVPRSGSYQGQPRSADFVLDTDWSIKRAERFICAVRWRRQPFLVWQHERWWQIDPRSVWAPALERRQAPDLQTRGQGLTPDQDQASHLGQTPGLGQTNLPSTPPAKDADERTKKQDLSIRFADDTLVVRAQQGLEP